jgi:hypothetical protein
MTSDLLLWSGAFFGVILCVSLVAFWWLNRTPNTEHRRSDRLPLFSGTELGLPTPPDGAAGVRAAPADPPASVGWGLAGPMEPVAPAAQVVTPPVAPAMSRPLAASGERAEGARPRATPAPPAPPRRPTPGAGTTTSAGAGAGDERPGTRAREFETRRLDPIPDRIPVPIVGTPVAADGVPGTMVEGHLLRFSVPAEGTLQFLPGRLEIATGLDAGREIRFVRLPGPDGTEVTFGRADGPLYRHIQLRDQTVSRAHARMRLVDGAWQLTNLSRTNPVVHNGRTLPDGEAHPLADGDKVEMGEVVFTFRSR